jgi:hypothetical protein
VLDVTFDVTPKGVMTLDYLSYAVENDPAKLLGTNWHRRLRVVVTAVDPWRSLLFHAGSP